MNRSVAFWLAVDAAPTLAAPWLRDEAIRVIARRRLAALLATATETGFYRERLGSAGADRDPEEVLASLAPVTKSQLRSAAGRALAGGRVRAGWLSSASSGSTGEPFRMFYDPRAWARLKYLVKWRSRSLCGARVTDRVALLDAVPPHPPAQRTRPAGRVARISVLQPPAAVAAELAAFAPDTIYALPSALLEAGAALRAGGARLGVKRIFTSGELLQPATRRAIAEEFAAPVFDVYGSSETKEIAWECRAGAMHVNADVVRLEAVDDHGQPVPDGTEGELVATLLVNHAMPLLRYRVGDRGSLLPGGCPCGLALPRLGIVTGRVADMVELAGGRRVSPYAFTCALERLPEMRCYQVTQLDAVRVRVRAVTDAGTDRRALTARVRRALQEEVASFLDAEVEFVDRLPSGPRAKVRVVQPLSTRETS